MPEIKEVLVVDKLAELTVQGHGSSLEAIILRGSIPSEISEYILNLERNGAGDTSSARKARRLYMRVVS